MEEAERRVGHSKRKDYRTQVWKSQQWKRDKLEGKKPRQDRLSWGKKSIDTYLPSNATTLSQPNIHYWVFLGTDLRNIFEAPWQIAHSKGKLKLLLFTHTMSKYHHRNPCGGSNGSKCVSK